MEQKYILSAIDAALQAGADILSIYNDPASDFEIEKKADNSPLTIADRKAHETITGFLCDTPFPILSEEGKHLPYAERCGWNALWIVDPLDGTKEFIKRNGEFTVNIAWVNHSVPVMGVIYLPVKQELYFAEESIGAYKLSNVTSRGNASLDELIASATRLPSVTERGKFVIVASRSHLTPETEAYIEEMKRQHSEVELISSGSSIKICLVAEGKADVYPRFAPTMEWDTAAGHAIARAAGLGVTLVNPSVEVTYSWGLSIYCHSSFNWVLLPSFHGPRVSSSFDISKYRLLYFGLVWKIPGGKLGLIESKAASNC